MNDSSYYPGHAGAVQFQADAVCKRCMGLGRLADDWCRPCAGSGYVTTSPEPALLDLADALSEATAELSALRVACQRALLALTGLMPYLTRLPPESEQFVRKAIKSIQAVARG